MYSHYHQSDYEGENTVVYIWHKGGYEKLKPFGFWTYGAIDGYSRRILWLEVGRTNNNPKIIANYFTDYIRQIGEAPRIVCADAGTENVYVTKNKSNISWWIDFLKTCIRDKSIFYDHDPLYLDCLRFCFMP